MSLTRTRRSVSELKPTDALLLLLLLLPLLMLPSSTWSVPRGTGPGHSTTIGYGSPRSAGAPRPLARPRSRRAKWAVRHGPVSREIAPQAPPPLSRWTAQPPHSTAPHRGAVERTKFDFPFAYGVVDTSAYICDRNI